ncbi:MAG: hypothetical protein AAF664_24450 [Planctomycetota bacterium]
MKTLICSIAMLFVFSLVGCDGGGEAAPVASPEDYSAYETPANVVEEAAASAAKNKGE